MSNLDDAMTSGRRINSFLSDARVAQDAVVDELMTYIFGRPVRTGTDALAVIDQLPDYDHFSLWPKRDYLIRAFWFETNVNITQMVNGMLGYDVRDGMKQAELLMRDTYSYNGFTWWALHARLDMDHSNSWGTDFGKCTSHTLELLNAALRYK